MKTLIAIAILITTSPVDAAPPGLRHLFPAGVQRGKSVAVSTGSSLDGASVSAWTSRADVAMKWSAKLSKFEIAADANAPPGVCWIRLHNAEGASPVRPFMVGLHPEVTEIEPNERLTQAQQVAGEFVVVNGALSRPEDVDCFAVKLKAGQTLVAAMTANQVLGSPMDGVLQVVSADGFVLEQNDDDQKLDPRIVFTARSDGVYYVRAFSFPEEPGQAIRFYQSPEAIYRLTLSTGPFLDHPWPLAATAGTKTTLALRGWNLGPTLKAFELDDRGQPAAASRDISDPRLANTGTCRIVPHATAIEPMTGEPSAAAPRKKIEIPSSVSGLIGKPNEIDEYVFSAVKGETIVVDVESRKLGFPLDPVIALVGPNGAVLAEADDEPGGQDATLTHRIEAAGDYRVRIFDRFGHGGDRFAYLLTVQPPQPQVRLAVAADSYSLTSNEPLQIEVNVERINGFSEELAVTAVDLPAGVSVQQAVSQREGTSSKSVKLTLQAAAQTARSGAFRIVALGKGNPPPAYLATASLPKFQSKVSQIWLNAPSEKTARPASPKAPGSSKKK